MHSSPSPRKKTYQLSSEMNHVRWSDCLRLEEHRSGTCDPRIVGVLSGEGIGAEIVGCALEVLNAISESQDLNFEIRHGGLIGHGAERASGAALTEDVIRFCSDVFAGNGAILNGPGGSRYVYDLRRHFDFFMKISPIRTPQGLIDASNVHPEQLRDVDILVTRENTGGAYQGRWSIGNNSSGERHAEHLITYSESQVRRFLDASAHLASQRRGELTVVWKEFGVPSISQLWRECAEEAAQQHQVHLQMVDIDLMAYRLIMDATECDVVAAPNLFGDVLGDLGGVIVGSRGMTFSGNYNGDGNAVYQTNHGAAYDLADTDTSNPIGQILSLAMMLRETFAQWAAAEAIEKAISCVFREGYRTADMARDGAQIIGTREMGRRISHHASEILHQASKAG